MTTASKPPRAPRIEWPTAAALTAVLAALVAVWVVASPEQRASMLTGVGAIGSVGLAVMRAMLSAQDLPPSIGEPSAPPRSNGIDKHDPLSRDSDRGALRVGALVLACLVCLPALGCGGSALRTHASVGTLAAVTVATTAPLVAPACDVALTACHGDAACVDRTGASCLAAAHAHDAMRAGVAGYLDAIEVASLADEGLVLPALLTGLRGLVALWSAAVVALASIGLELPALPALAAQLLGGAS